MIVSQELAVEVAGGGEKDCVWQPQTIMPGAELGRTLGDRVREGHDRDSHACDCVARVGHAVGSGERDQRFAVGIGRGEQGARRLISGLASQCPR